MEKTNTQKTKKGALVALLVIGLIGISLIGITSAEITIIYKDNTEYSVSRGYDIPDSFIYKATVNLLGTSAGECAYVTFTYAGGTSYTTSCQKVNYLSWTNPSFSNPYPSLKVTSIGVTGGSHTYLKEFIAYGETVYTGASIDDYSGLYCGEECEQTKCGNGIKETGEECDAGAQNGVSCSAVYNSQCTYCSSSCKSVIIKGPYCGDGVINGEERCDDGNQINNDKCTNECKKPFEIITEDFGPLVWGCDHRVVYDDGTEPGRITLDGEPLMERINNYAFEGEQIQWKVLVMDKNGIEKVKDVYVIVNEEMEANCARINEYYPLPNNDEIGERSIINPQCPIDPSCNARILEEKLTTFNPETMAYYLCTLTVESPDGFSMIGPADITVEAEDLDGVFGRMDEEEHWYLNPVINLLVEGDLTFDEVRPGTSAYSEMIKVGNDAESGSGVWLDMFISGTDFYDSSGSGAKCPDTNQLGLDRFRYYVSNGASSSYQDPRADNEGYLPIEYGIGFNDPKPFYDRNEILQTNKAGAYYTSNLLVPGAEMSLIFRLDLPEPCNGDFNSGQIFFWGEAI